METGGPMPISQELIGDQGPWVRYIPSLFHFQQDPDGPWEPPKRPREDDPQRALLERRIAFWAPLLTLTFGCLGWVRPDLAIERWASEGRPTTSAHLKVLERWWGPNSQALPAWARHGGGMMPYCDIVSSRLGLTMDSTQPLSGQPENRWAEVAGGGSDPLHLGHFIDHLFGPGNYGSRAKTETPLVIRGSDDERREVSMLLPRYAGWYAAVSDLLERLPARNDGRSWRAHVTVAPVGYLGAFRRSRKTGRAFSGPHRVHELGA